ncbi:MAG: TlpA family protein disulfide reductase [Gammaproteobacteria bacterium]
MSALARLLVLIFPLYAFDALAAGRSHESMPGSGANEAADVGLVDMAGKVTNLESHTGDGKWLVVMVWSVTCGVCAREVPVYSVFHDEHKDRDIKVLGVALDGYAQRNAIESTMKQWDMRFPTLVAEVGVFAFNYELATGERLMGTPTFMVYTPQGELVANNPGPMRTSALVDYIARYEGRQ